MTTSPLTAREDQVRALVVDGLTNDEIAARLAISSRTVEAHLRMLFRKLKVSRRDELAAPTPPEDERRVGESDDKVIRRLEESLSERDRQVRSYEEALQLLIGRQFPLFDEQVKISIKVGCHSFEDMVVERHRTTPNPYLVYRVIRPISADHVVVPGDADSLALACEVVGADVGVAVQLLPDLEGRPRAMILFQPGLQEPTEWILRYRTPGLWDPLRDRGEDAMAWAAGTLDGRHADGLSDLEVTFEFPSGATSTQVVERRGVGQMTHDSEDGRSTFHFHDNSRAGGRYHWSLQMTLAQEVSGSGARANSLAAPPSDRQPPLEPLPPDTPAPSDRR